MVCRSIQSEIETVQRAAPRAAPHWAAAPANLMDLRSLAVLALWNISGFSWSEEVQSLLCALNTSEESHILNFISTHSFVYPSNHPIHPYLFNSIEICYVWILYKYPQVPSRPFWPFAGAAAWWRCLPWMESQPKHTYVYSTYAYLYISTQ